MPLKSLDLMPTAELKHELRLCADEPARAAIVARLRERLRDRVAELAAGPALMDQCSDDELAVLVQVAVDVPTRDALARVKWARDAERGEAEGQAVLTRAERAQARRELRRAWGDAVEIETDSDGCLAVDVDHGNGEGHTFATISSPRCYMLAALTADRDGALSGYGINASPAPGMPAARRGLRLRPWWRCRPRSCPRPGPASPCSRSHPF